MRKIDNIKNILNKGKQYHCSINKEKGYVILGYTKKFFVGGSPDNNPFWIPITQTNLIKKYV